MPPINKIEINKERSLFDDKVQEIRGFLTKHYDIRVPIQDPSKIQITCKDKNRYVFAPNFDDISLHLLSEGISVSDTMLRKILRSPNQIPPVNPIAEYFDAIRGKWKSRSQIDLLCSHITPRVWDDNPPEWYRERADKFIKKWLVACVACWLEGVPNDVAFGLVQAEGGSGKTFLTKFILPKALEDFYIASSKEEKNFNIDDVYTRYMIVNFEELNGLNKGSINSFKQAQSADHLVTKLRHEEFPTRKKRIACSVFSTNFSEENGGFIQPWYGSDTRRLGIVEITAIDRAYSKKVDIDQLWAEALTLYESTSFDYTFGPNDYHDFNTYNARYKYETDAMNYVRLYITHPDGAADGEKLNSTQILQKLNAMRRIKSEDLNKITPQKIGQAMSALGFKQESVRNEHSAFPVKGYHVKFL